MSGWLQAAFIIVVLVALHVPLGDYMAGVYTNSRHWRAEKVIYRLSGVDPEADQRWPHYLASLLAFSGVGVLLLYAILRLQRVLPLSLGHAGFPPAAAFNTAVSFTTNTSWQSYAGESAMGHFALAAGLGVEAFASAAVGMAAGLALTRGLIRRRTDRIGNFWVDLVRSITRILLPLSLLFAIAFVTLGVIQNVEGTHATVTTLAGGRQRILGGPVGSWEPIKLMSSDGGGFFNASSAHPFENPTPVTNVIEIVLMLLIPAGFIRMFGWLVGDRRQGWTLLTVAGVLFMLAIITAGAAQNAHHGTVPTAVGAATEGTETRFGVAGSAPRRRRHRHRRRGRQLQLRQLHQPRRRRPDGQHDARRGEPGRLRQRPVRTTHQLTRRSLPGRTHDRAHPEYLRKRIGAREIKMVALYQLATPAAILIGSAIAIGSSNARAAIGNTSAHGLSEVVYAFTSSANSNGSAFAGLNSNTTFFNTALARALAGQQPGIATVGTLRSHGPAFALMTVGVVLVVSGLSYFPALSLGPLADGLHHAFG